MSIVVIQPDTQINDSSIRSEFPFMARIIPADLSFYTALGYLVLYRLSCVSKNLQKEVRWKILEYSKFELKAPNIDRDIQIPAEIETNSSKIEELLNIVSDDKKTIAEKERNFKAQAIVICRAFQRILAAIFAKSNKIPEAEDILAGKSVSYLNQYYFNNFASSLSLKITIRALDENPIEAIDQTNNDRINVDLYCFDKRTHDYAIIKHRQDIEYICGNPVNTSEWPFVVVRKKNHVPVSPPVVSAPVVNHKNNPAVPAPASNPWAAGQGHGQGNFVNHFSGNNGPPQGYYAQGPPAFTGQANPPQMPSSPPQFQMPPSPPQYQMPPSPPQYQSPPMPPSPPTPPTPPNFPGQYAPGPPPVAASTYKEPSQNYNPGKTSEKFSEGDLSLPEQLHFEQKLINCLSEIFTSNSPFFTEDESKTIKKNLSKIKDQDKKLLSKEMKNIKECLSKKCKAEHNSSDFVIFKSCRQRHCKSCLADLSDYRIICDCRRDVNFEDLGFLLDKQIYCSYCKDVIEDISQAVFQAEPIHRTCFVNLMRK